MKHPSTPSAWAKRLNTVLLETVGQERFPVDVERLAREYSQRMFDDPITKIVGEPLDGFDGGLFPSRSGKPRWLIVYNSVTRSKERVRYTLAHELGHYLLHRRPGQSIQCSVEDMSIWRGEYQRREAEANRFAAGVLMPTDDYCRQVDGQSIDLELFRSCADRYGVSLTPAILDGCRSRRSWRFSSARWMALSTGASRANRRSTMAHSSERGVANRVLYPRTRWPLRWAMGLRRAAGSIRAAFGCPASRLQNSRSLRIATT